MDFLLHNRYLSSILLKIAFKFDESQHFASQLVAPLTAKKQHPHGPQNPMPRPIPAVVAGAAGAAALWSSSPSFVVPRNSEVGTAIRVEGRNGVGLSANMEGVSGSSLGLASVGTAVATLGLAAMRASQKKTQTRQSSSRIVCAAGNVGKKRCLVMGGTRFIGCYLVAKLREQGHDVVVCNRGKTNGGKPERLPGVPRRGLVAIDRCCGVTVLVVKATDLYSFFFETFPLHFWKWFSDLQQVAFLADFELVKQ